MEEWRLKPVRLLASDIDGTLLGDDAGAARFRSAWQALDAARRPLLVYNSGRMIDDILSLVDSRQLPPPDYVIGAVGTMIADGRLRERLEKFTMELGPPFDAAIVSTIMMTIEGALPQAAVDHPHKVSWHLPDAAEERLRDIAERLAGGGLDVKLIYSCSRDLDILPRAGGKGSALAWICRELAVNLEEVVVAGDTGNDREMFDMPHVRGVVVANALPELRQVVAKERRHFLARCSYADGVLEGLRHWCAI
ncbi:HAD family hydrolase [Sinorhizobium numidicum]|uniref:HAD family hydrolase n=1 Tax=Sinorhizobium numidicum TaxID=680248 RepID=A0ABY8CVA7_9HYPH|nr:HAD-IIB family hydrolase [Sinorhizobium numidicum]WEX75921.1 HAD family hydrolase [Sinorhizobium numidicum]WEX82580.1 HAD family hydrolase [Sinorhizobium numidicum]